MLPLALLSLCAADPWQYPATRTVDQVDVYHGTPVPDPYRWLEDDTAPEVTRWVGAQNKVTRAYFDRIAYVPELRKRLRHLLDYAKEDLPRQRGDLLFTSKNTGLQNQSVLHVQTGVDSAPRPILDPNTFSKGGTARLQGYAPSRDGKWIAYRVSQGGSDWSVLQVLETATGAKRPDKVEWLKSGSIAWWGNGVFYSRYDAPEKGRELTAKNEFQRVYYHRLGTPQADDELVYEDKLHGQRFHNVITTDDERYAILYVTDRGKGKDGNAIYVRDLASPGKTFAPVVSEITDERFTVIGNVGTRLLILTNQRAPNRKVMAYDMASNKWTPVIAEKKEPLLNATAAGNRIFARYAKDVVSRVYVHTLDGKLEHEVKLPAPGIAMGFDGPPEAKQVFYTFTSLRDPLTVYRYDVATRQSHAFRAPVIPAYQPDAFETHQVFYTSKDGTRVPMFLVHKKGIKKDGANPTLLAGYGGFNIACSPSFQAPRLALLEQGFVLAQACIRGGSEYGESWHQAGMKLRKQNVFDDFIAAAEWLISNKYTSPAKLALNGTSNGGLLVGAVINQRPELFRAAVPQAGVMDMLRYQKFTIGWNWAADYGSSDNADEFRALRAYSPLHNLRKGGRYPSVLVTTADHDDRVVPAHSFKYAAALQAAAHNERPALIRIETDSGHGASSTGKLIAILSDVYAFLMKELGVEPVALR